MQAMILAGGLSTRLHPLTLNVPKPLVPLMNQPMIEHVMNYLTANSIQQAVMNVHYHAAQVERYAGDGSRWGLKLKYVYEKSLSGSAGAVKKAASYLSSTFVVVPCDTISTVNLYEALKFHAEHEAEVTVVLSTAPDTTECGVAVTDDSDRIILFREKPAASEAPSIWCNTGIYIMEPAVLQRIPPSSFYDFGSQLFPTMATSGGRIFGMRQVAYWCDVGSPQSYRRAHFDALKGTIKLKGAPGDRVAGGILIGANTSIARDSRLTAPCCIGSGCSIDSGSSIAASILWPGVHVGRGARIERSIVARPQVAAGCVLRDGEYV